MTEKTCACTQRHVPLPHQYFTIGQAPDQITVCPTTYFNIVSLIDWHNIFGGRAPGSVTKHFSKYVRDTVEALANGTPFLAENEEE